MGVVWAVVRGGVETDVVVGRNAAEARCWKREVAPIEKPVETLEHCSSM